MDHRAGEAGRAAAGGLLATWLPLRVVIVISAVLLLLPALLLDRRPALAEEPAPA